VPILKTCSRCGVTLLAPTVTDGKCFCSPECEALYRDPEVLSKIAREPPGTVRKRAAIVLAVALPISVYLVMFPPRFLGYRWIIGGAFLVPLYFLVELTTGMTFPHTSLWYQSLPEWKRALIVLAIMVCAAGAMAGGIYLFIKSSPNF
jgi:hypothetical protein